MDNETTLAIQSVFNELNKYCTKTEYANLKDSVITLSYELVNLQSQISDLLNNVANINKLAGLLDVNITDIKEGDLLQYSNNKWVNVKASSLITNLSTNITLASLTDVNLTSPTNNQLLKFNGTKWINGDPTASTISTYSQIQALTGYATNLQSDINTYRATLESTLDNKYLPKVNGIATNLIVKNLIVKDATGVTTILTNDGTGINVTGNIKATGEITAFKISA